MTTTDTLTHTPLRRGADDGLWFGMYLTAMFFASIFAPALPILSVVSLLLVVCVPFVVFRSMARYRIHLADEASFATLWIYGVVLFFFGVILAGFVLTAYMTWVNPDYISSQLQALAALSGHDLGATIDQAASLASSMLEAGFVPRPIDLVTELIMLAIVTGSGLSIVLSLIIMARRPSESR